MSKNLFEPPKARVADAAENLPTPWARAAWIQIPVFIGLTVLCLSELKSLTMGLTEWGVMAGIALSAGLLYPPARSILTRDESSQSFGGTFATT